MESIDRRGKPRRRQYRGQRRRSGGSGRLHFAGQPAGTDRHQPDALQEHVLRFVLVGARRHPGNRAECSRSPLGISGKDDAGPDRILYGVVTDMVAHRL